MRSNPWLAQVPPFSFTYAGEPSSERFSRWESDGSLDESGAREHTARDVATGLVTSVRRKTFTDVEGVDWLLEFTNESDTDTPILEDIQPLDWFVEIPKDQRVRIHHANGSRCRVDDFIPMVSKLHVGQEVTFAPIGGRSSDGVLPFFNLDYGTGGVVVAIGWSGQWKVSFRREEDGIRITAGMERTHLLLHPGETIRSPRILLLRWWGDDHEAGNNLLRRTILTHYSPMENGAPALAPISHNRQLVFYFTGDAGEEDSLNAIERGKELGLDAFWVDACWYGTDGDWWQDVGDWRVRRERFPNGLKPVGDASHNAGMKFILWFEPERVRPNTPIHTEHPDFLLERPGDSDNFLFDLGNPDARAWLTDLLSGHIGEAGVDIYRQDFNFEPAGFWEAADAPDRIGMHEILHTQGLYEMWDELKRRHPGLLIDNCASGGRRIDLETTSRSFPLWRSDFTDLGAKDEGAFLQIGAQCQTAGLSRWVPLHAASVWTFEPYDVRSSFSTGVSLYTDILAEDYPVEQVKQAIAEMKRLRPYLLGDFYELVPLTVAEHDWCAYQFHRPDLDSGCAIFLRRDASPYPSLEVTLRGLDADGAYEMSASPTYAQAPFKSVDTSDLVHMSVTVPEAPGSVLIEYRPRRK